MRVLGIDPSMTATASCLIGTDPHSLRIDVSRTKATGQDAAAKLERMRCQAVFATVFAQDADVIVMEAPSMASMGRATRDLAGLWWLMYEALYDTGTQIGVVPPSVLKKWITGAGNADKFRVGQHAAKRWPDVELRSDDEADSLVLAGIGLHHRGNLPWTPTTFQADALAKVEWTAARPNDLLFQGHHLNEVAT